MVPFLLAQILMQASFYSQIGAKNVSLDFDDWWKEFTNHQVFTAHVDLTNNQLSDLICNPENDDIVQKNVKTNNTHLPNPIFMNLTNEEMANSTMIALLDSYTTDDTQLIIITFGILGNILTILYIPFKRKLRKPFYYCIINLAVGDTLALFCSPYFLQLARNELSVLKCQYFTFYFVFEIVKQSSNLLSALGVLLLGYVRYLLFVHPFRSRIYLTKRRVFLSFFFCFLISVGYGCITAYFTYISKGTQYVIIGVIADASVLILVTSILLILFYHRFKTAQTSAAARNTKLPMTVVTIVILALHVLSLLSSLITNLRNFFANLDMTNTFMLYSVLVVVNAIVVKRFWTAFFPNRK